MVIKKNMMLKVIKSTREGLIVCVYIFHFPKTFFVISHKKRREDKKETVFALDISYAHPPLN